MIGAIMLVLVTGAIACFLIPNDALERMGGLVSWLLTLVLGLVGAWVGWWIFTGLLGIGDADKFDLGGIIGAILGAVIVWRSSRSSCAVQGAPGSHKTRATSTTKRDGG